MSPYDAILVAFDAGKKTIRHDWMEDYKAGRSPMPDEFRMQISYIKEFLPDGKDGQHECDDSQGTRQNGTDQIYRVVSPWVG